MLVETCQLARNNHDNSTLSQAIVPHRSVFSQHLVTILKKQIVIQYKVPFFFNPMTAVTSEIVLKCKSLLIQITHSQERETQLKEEKRVEEFSLKKGERCVPLSVSNNAEIISDLNIGTLCFQSVVDFYINER